LPRVAELVRGDWRAMLDRDGAAPVDLSGDACPACGCAQALVAGACPECGLQLE
jgi:hypothetical protein